MSEIGGYFELELESKSEYLHFNLLKVNSGRNALELILRNKKVNKVFIPYYTCDVILEPLEKLGLNYEFYDVDENLEPIMDCNLLKDEDSVLYTNYFGIKDKFIKKFSKDFGKGQLIIDNAQALFSRPLTKWCSFYSPRKFVGVSDGGYISNLSYNITLEQDLSHERMLHLLKRIECGANVGYKDFIANDEKLKFNDTRAMSILTEKILSSIDYDLVKKKRLENFNFLHNYLENNNLLKIDIDEECVPLVYPFRVLNGGVLRKKLIDNKVYCAKYWPNVENWCDEEKFSYRLADEIVALPIDQRYSQRDMLKIIKVIKNG
ncbi:hypothetical protein SAMN04488018_1229 [Myroides marinus]|uniref:dTDP-4-amino-4,6-dideoxygalactose transaminase n=1 Tax=Myroides marinus TaxID=703342 RepID=A0A1H6XJ42_9FLAO|nr:hypothetical protein [Myroides marinus]SEJ29103.1 hypothetical protein SAMN04488018_1229 [Myroides marinus]